MAPVERPENIGHNGNLAGIKLTFEPGRMLDGYIFMIVGILRCAQNAEKQLMEFPGKIIIGNKQVIGWNVHIVAMSVFPGHCRRGGADGEHFLGTGPLLKREQGAVIMLANQRRPAAVEVDRHVVIGQPHSRLLAERIESAFVDRRNPGVLQVGARDAVIGA